MSLNNISNKALKTLSSQSFNYNEHWRYTDINKFKKIKNKAHSKQSYDILNMQDSFQCDNNGGNNISILK